MKISYQHLLRFIPEKPTIDELSDKLFQLGHEHETIDSIFDIEFTPNRGDCLSLLGLARDLSVFYNTALNIDSYQKEIPILKLDFKDKTSGKSQDISFLNIKTKGEVKQYKKYLEDYFNDLSLNKNNFFTDVSNYIAYEMGQPTHCYDFLSIEGGITLEENTNKYEFKTLLGKDITLTGEDLVFSNNGNIINLAGIVGSLDSACSEKTTNVLIECAYFAPESIIGKAIKYNLHSDASHKFERGVDPLCHDKILRRFIQIVQDHTDIVSIEIYNSPTNFKETKLEIDIEKVNNVLGLEVSLDRYKDILTKLGFVVNTDIKVPSYRSDIAHQNDLAEELARVIGFDNIPIKSIDLPRIQNNSFASIEEKLKSFLIDNGFSEVINSTFCSNKTKSSIRVDNPLDSTREYIRTNLTESLIQNLIYNEKRQKDSIKLFEISDIYLPSDTSFVYEKKIAIIISGRRGHNFEDFSKSLDKNYIQGLFKEINLSLDNEIININRDKLDSKVKSPIFTAEFLINDISEEIKSYIPLSTPLDYFVTYKPISEFPSSYRDLSFSVKNPLIIGQINNILLNSNAKNLKESFMFDFYKNPKTNATKIGYRFIFQANDRTLTDIEIDKTIKKIIEPILFMDSVSLPR